MIECLRQGTVHVISSDSSISVQQLDELRTAMECCLGRGQPRVVLNLESTPWIDGAGLEFLLDWRDRYVGLGGSLRLSAPTPLCATILRITGVADEFDVYNDSVAALSSFAQ